MSVAVEDDVNIGGRVSVDRCEVAALAGGIPGTVGSAFVVFGNDASARPSLLRRLASAFTALTGSPMVRLEMPAGETKEGRSWVTAPTTPMRTPSLTMIVDALRGAATFVVPFS